MRRTLLAALALLVLGLAGQPLAQLQMPDPKQMAGIPRPVEDLPDGTISVRLIRGQLSNNISNHPVEMHVAGDRVKAQRVNTDENGRAQFSSIAAGTLVRAVAIVDGERLESREFPAPQKGGIRLMLVATAHPSAGESKTAGRAATGEPATPGDVRLGGSTRFVIELVDEAVQVYYLLDVINGAQTVVNPDGPLVVSMPSGALSTTVLEGSSHQATASGNRVTITGPFPPGRTAVQVAFQLPYDGASLQFTQRLPVPLDHLAVVVRKIGATEIDSPRITNRQEMTADGRTYLVAAGPPVASGQEITLTLKGLPHQSATPQRIAVGLMIMVVGLGAWTAGSAGQRTAAATRRQDLNRRRERLFTDLVNLEEQRRAGKIDPARYASHRASTVAQLEKIYGELDVGPESS